MNDAEIRQLLSDLDGEVELPPDRAAAARAAMLAEFDVATGQATSTTAPDAPPAGRRRRGNVFLAAAALAVVVAGVAVLSRGSSEPVVTDEMPTVDRENYLRACVDFQADVAVDGSDWREVLAELERTGVDDSAYRSTLADALDDLAFAPSAAPFASETRRVAIALRSGASLDVIVVDLQEIERLSETATGLPCLR